LRRIEINCDLGESTTKAGMERDKSLMTYIGRCNICCGFHASDAYTIDHTIREAVRHGLRIGAHPSFKDRQNFGRAIMHQNISELMADISYQVGALKSMTERRKARLQHVKPHGALYHLLGNDRNYAEAFIELIDEIDPELAILGMPGSQLEKICLEQGKKFIREAFADRHYDSLNQLRSRSKPDAIIRSDNEMNKRLKDIMNGKVTDYSGTTHSCEIDSICIHSDTPEAVDMARTIFNYLNTSDVELY